MKYPHLFQPGTIGNLNVSNRFVQTPAQTRGGDTDGYVTSELIDFHKARSHDNQGPGIVIAQQTFAWPEVKLPRGLALWDDKYIEKLSSLASALKKGGARAFLQLGGAGSRLAGIDVAPSPVIGSWDMKKPREITRKEMMRNLEYYASAGKRLFNAGFEGFSLHACAGKYLAQFLSPWSNRRNDEYGGTCANRVRYILQIIDAVRERTRDDFPIILRLPAEEFFTGGLSIHESIEQIALLSDGGVDAFAFTGGGQECLWPDCPSYAAPIFPTERSLFAIRQALPNITIIANGGIHEPEMAENILERGLADFIGICRPILADPDYVSKVYEGREDTIRRCIRCNNCHTWANRPHLAERGMCCTVNPALMVEKQMEPKPTSQIKKIVVLGGGLAGLSAAATLAERGHQVILHEKTGELGGQWLAASAGKEKKPYRELTEMLLKRINDSRVDIRLHSAPLKSEIVKCAPDAVVLATGAIPRPLLDIDIIYSDIHNKIDILYGIDVLKGDKSVSGKHVVVLGGRYIGMEVALLLAEQGNEVSLVEKNEIGRGVIGRIRTLLFQRIAENRIRVFPMSSIFRIANSYVEIAHGGSVFPIHAETMVLAIGTVPVKTYQECDFGVPSYAIGDCHHIGDAREAMAQGMEVGLKI